MRYAKDSFMGRMLVLNRYVGYGVHVVPRHEIRDGEHRSRERKHYLVEGLHFQQQEYWPVSAAGTAFKVEAVLPVLRPWESVLTHVDSEGREFLRELARLALFTSGEQPVDMSSFTIQRISGGVKVIVERRADGRPKVSLLLTHDWELMWVDGDGGHPVLHQVQCHEYFLENLFAIGLTADQFYPLV